MQVDTTVLGGLPVTVEFSVDGPDESVGLFGYAIADWSITHINGRKCKKAPQWLYNRIEKTRGEEDRITAACMASFDDRDDDFNDDFYD